MGVFVIFKISPRPSFPKRGLKVSIENSEEPKQKKAARLSRLLRILTSTLKCDIQTVNQDGNPLWIVNAKDILVEVVCVKEACFYKIGKVLCDLP